MGQIVVAENRKVIQPLQGGRIQQLHVIEGDEVEQGQLLITLDDTAIRSHRDNLQHQYLSALAQESRLIAEQHDWPEIDFPEVLLQDSAQYLVERIIALQRQLFQHRRQSPTERNCTFIGTNYAASESAERFASAAR